MNKEEAKEHAQRLAQQVTQIVYVLRYPEHFVKWGGGRGWDTAAEEDLARFYPGLRNEDIVGAVLPDGSYLGD